MIVDDIYTWLPFGEFPYAKNKSKVFKIGFTSNNIERVYSTFALRVYFYLDQIGQAYLIETVNLDFEANGFGFWQPPIPEVTSQDAMGLEVKRIPIYADPQILSTVEMDVQLFEL